MRKGIYACERMRRDEYFCQISLFDYSFLDAQETINGCERSLEGVEMDIVNDACLHKIL